ncbi:MAG: PAS domain S-box protein [Acidobacteria bacterium]|nr:PAS domain S-box protein [Acidobacteriota bacterium]MBI3488823.1 PAS domain S-box protein [Acidobacteriota bacterium]
MPNDKKTEQALRASELSYRRLFEAAQDGILILEARTGRVQDANPFLVKLLGIPLQEMLGKTVGELSPFRDLLSNQIMLERLQQNGYIRYEDLPLETKDGRRIAVEFVSNVYQSGDDTVIQCNIRDITARKKAEASNTRLAMAVEQAAETIMITDTRGVILYVNPAFEKTSGYSETEALGRQPRILKSDKQDDAFYRNLWASLERGERWEGHFINRRKDATLYEEDATISPVRDTAGTIVNYVAIKRDVTREVQLEAQFRQAQKMEAIGQLAGGVAHDFNNLLAVIQMQTDLLGFAGDLSQAQAQSIKEIVTCVDRATDLTRQLLLFSRREAFQPVPLDLNEAIQSTINMLKRIIREDVEMQFTFAAGPLLLLADPGMLNQILLNLAVNARDAMPQGGRLLIETSTADFDDLAVAQSVKVQIGAFVCLSVSDTGCGIAPDILPHIFEPFFTTKAVGKGTGLGLATVFGIVQQHQGWANVYTEADRGTMFRIYLPRLAGEAVAEYAPALLQPLRGGTETVLLVEDEPALRLAVGKALSQLGYHILEAASGIKALAVWRQHQQNIHLLLTDLVMPDGLSGKDLADLLLKENPALKVVYMSGYSAEVVDKDFPIQERIHFLNKPFSLKQLAQILRTCVETPA